MIGRLDSLVHFNDEWFRFLAYSLLRKSSYELAILQNGTIYNSVILITLYCTAANIQSRTITVLEPSTKYSSTKLWTGAICVYTWISKLPKCSPLKTLTTQFYTDCQLHALVITVNASLWREVCCTCLPVLQWPESAESSSSLVSSVATYINIE